MRRHRSWYVAALAAGAAVVLLGAKCSLFNKAPAVPVVTGPAQGVAGVPVTFKATATDPDGDSIAFQFDWGDTTTPAWSAFLASGETLSAAHTYADSGNYMVRAKAKDRGGKESGWSGGANLSLLAAGGCYPDTVLCRLVMPWMLFGAAISRDGSVICLGPGSGGSDSLLFIRTDDMSELRRAYAGGVVPAVAFSSDNSSVFVYSNEVGLLRRVGIGQGSIEASVAIPSSPKYIVATRDGECLIVDGGSVALRLAADDLAVLDTLSLPDRASDAVANAAGTTLYISSQQGLAVIDIASFSLTSFLAEMRDGWTVALSPCDSVLYMSSGIDSGIVAIRASGMEVIGRVNLHSRNVGDVAVSPDGQILYVGVPTGISYVRTRELTLVDSLDLESWGHILVHPSRDTVYYVDSRRVNVIGTH